MATKRNVIPRQLPASGGGGDCDPTIVKVPGLRKQIEYYAHQMQHVRSKPSGIEGWQKEIETDDLGMTMREIAELMNKPKSNTLRMVRRGIKEGRYIEGRAMRPDSMGRLQCVPVYRIKENHG